MSDNANGVELTKAVSHHEELGQAPKAKCESLHSLDDLSNVDLEGGAKGGKEDALGAVKFTKSSDDSAVEIGGQNEAAFAGMGKDELMKYANDPFWVRLRWFLFILFWLAWLAMLAGAIIIVVLAPKCPAPAPLEYWQKGVVYSVNVKSFQDSNADGKGDLKGLMGRLDHFVHLGVDIIALSPVFQGNMEKYGLAVTDFKNINPDFGTLEDFKALTEAAKAKNLKVIMDFVPNHSSKDHPWFTKSINSESDFIDYYVWKSSPPTNWMTVFKTDAWTSENITRKQYYYHKYDSDQPDLNLRNVRVREEMNQTFRFWLDNGASGFRLLSVPYLFEDRDAIASDNEEEKLTKNLDETYNYIAEIRGIMQEYEDGDGNHRVLLVEMEGSNPESIVKYYGYEEERLADLPVDSRFLINGVPGDFNGNILRQTIESYIESVPAWGWPTWVMGTGDAQRVSSRYSSKLVDALTMVQLLLPGTPISYYGEEIGMEDVNPAPEGCPFNPLTPDFSCNQARSPFQWDDSTHAGFSESDPWMEVSHNRDEINAKTQMGRQESHLTIYKAVVALRSQPALMFGDLAFPKVNQTNIFAFTRIRKGAPGYLVILNSGMDVVTLDLSEASSISSEIEIVIRSGQGSIKEKKEKNAIPVGPQEGLVISFVPQFK